MSHGFLSLWFFSKKLHKVVTRHEGLLLKVRFSWETWVLKQWWIYFCIGYDLTEQVYNYLSKGNCNPERKWRLPLRHIMYCLSMLQQFLGEDPCETKSESSASYNNLPLIIYFSCVCQLFRDAYWFLGVTLHQVVNKAN